MASAVARDYSCSQEAVLASTKSKQLISQLRQKPLTESVNSFRAYIHAQGASSLTLTACPFNSPAERLCWLRSHMTHAHRVLSAVYLMMSLWHWLAAAVFFCLGFLT